MDNGRAVRNADLVVLAIKPQDLDHALGSIRGKLLPGTVVLSIVAGARLKTLEDGLGHGMLVRAMPNMPALIGEAMTVWTATARTDVKQKEIARSVLSAIGDELYVGQEKYLDMATAVSGSGPAYVFLFAEALIDAGVHVGLPRDIAQRLTLQTLLGSTRAMQVMGKHPAELRNMVTSPAGTTTEGLLELEKGKLSYLVKRAVTAAYKKATALGGHKA